MQIQSKFENFAGIFDHDGSGRLSLNEFVDLWKFITEWKKKFEAADRDKSGTIDAFELKKALVSFVKRLSFEN